jgi:hypothetical protein
MEDDNIIPYQTSPSLTVKQAVMHILGYRGPYSYMVHMDLMEFDLFDYLRDLQEDADCAFGNASYELWMLKQTDSPSPEAINIAEGKVESTKAELEKANKLPELAENYRQLIDHEIKRARLGKRSPLVVDEDESTRTGQLRVNTASFQEWFEGMELDDATEASAPVALPVDEDAFDKELSRKSAVSLHVTLGLLVSLFAESSGGEFGSGQKPKVINIAKKIDEYATQLNDGYPLDWQSTQAIRKRIDLARSALKSYI